MSTGVEIQVCEYALMIWGAVFFLCLVMLLSWQNFHKLKAQDNIIGTSGREFQKAENASNSKYV